MAEVKSGDEPTLPTKRTSDGPLSQPKKPKLRTHVPNPEPTTTIINGKEAHEPQNDIVSKDDSETNQEKQGDEVGDEEVEPVEVIDRKGKGILIQEDEVEEDDDGDSDSDSDSDSGIGDGFSDDSDFADDPLAEVDLDNILPSRTRRKTIHPGVYISADIPEEDSDDSDDPDA